MPAGSAVAFYRDSRIDAVESDPQTFVNFVFDSELEEPSQSQTTTPIRVQPVVTLPSPPPGELPAMNEIIVKLEPAPSQSVNPVVNGLKPQTGSPDFAIPSLVQSKAENKSSDDSVNIQIPSIPLQSKADFSPFLD
jgi:hypothetical protein